MAKVYKRTDRDCWVADYRDHRGKRHRLTAKTRDKAETLLADGIKRAKLPGSAVDPSIALEAYAERWLEDVQAEMDLRTYESYRGNLLRHVLPELGHVSLGAITTGVVRNFLRAKQRAGYAQNTVRLMRAALSVLLSDAVLDEISRATRRYFRAGASAGPGE